MHSDLSNLLILGQGLAGSALAWRLHLAGSSLRIIDRGDNRSASHVAAGLITPITGRRMTRAPDFLEHLATVIEFYRRVESATNTALLDVQPAVRLFENEIERDFFRDERAEELADDAQVIADANGTIIGFEMPRSARLRVPEYLAATRAYFSAHGEFVEADVDVASDIQIGAGGIEIRKLDLAAKRLVFCQGFQSAGNPWFPNVPDEPTKGEVLRVRLGEYHERRVVHRGIWIAPERESGELLVGATYDRGDLSNEATSVARTTLLEQLQAVTSEVPEVLDHKAGIRAGMKNRKPVVQLHDQFPALAIVNGLGSRGALLAPMLANELVQEFANARPSVNLRVLESGSAGALPSQVSPTRNVLSRSEPTRGKSLTQIAHNIVRRALRDGDTAIDATAGNGHDTLFLARCVGSDGRIISIDIQAAAIEATRRRLVQAGVSNVRLIHADHAEALEELVQGGMLVSAVMFNLGYLPNGDKTITTRSEQTALAIHAAIKLLGPRGVVTIVAYRGHPGGLEEAMAVEQLLEGERRTGSPSYEMGVTTADMQLLREGLEGSIHIDRIEGDAENELSPILFVVRKLGSAKLSRS